MIKILYLSLIFITSSYSFDQNILNNNTKQIPQPEFYSIGMLPEGYTFVCIDSYKWLQYYESDKIVLEKLYYEDDESGEIKPHKCE